MGISRELCQDNNTGGNFQRTVPGQQHWREFPENCSRTTPLVGISRELCQDNTTGGNFQINVPGQQHWWEFPENCATTLPHCREFLGTPAALITSVSFHLVEELITEPTTPRQTAVWCGGGGDGGGGPEPRFEHTHECT